MSMFRRAMGRLAVVMAVTAALVVGVPVLASAMTPGLSARVEAELGLNAGAPPPAAAEDILGDDGASVTLSNGQTWILTVGYISDAPDDSLSLGLERIVTAGGSGAELHLWQFATTAKSELKFDAATGKGTVESGSAAKPVATVNLAFSATSHSPVTCATGSETVYSGTLTGTVTLATGLTGGGTVGGSSVSFDAKGSAPSISVDSGCVQSVNDCVATTLFASAETGVIGSGIDGTLGGTALDEAGVETSTSLSSPKGATREDAAVLEKNAKLKWTAKTKTLSVSTSSSGIVTGSATIQGGTVKTESEPCSFGGTSYKLSLTEGEDASYSSPSGEALTAHTSLTGDLVVPDSTTAGYDVITVKKS